MKSLFNLKNDDCFDDLIHSVIHSLVNGNEIDEGDIRKGLVQNNVEEKCSMENQTYGTSVQN